MTDTRIVSQRARTAAADLADQLGMPSTARLIRSDSPTHSSSEVALIEAFAKFEEETLALSRDGEREALIGEHVTIRITKRWDYSGEHREWDEEVSGRLVRFLAPTKDLIPESNAGDSFSEDLTTAVRMGRCPGIPAALPWESNAGVREAIAIPVSMPGHWDTQEGRDKALEFLPLKREQLPNGDMSDLALANRMFMAGRNDLDLLAWQQSAKDRIRWLSVQLAAALLPASIDVVGKAREALEAVHGAMLNGGDGAVGDFGWSITKLNKARPLIRTALASLTGEEKP